MTGYGENLPQFSGQPVWPPPGQPPRSTQQRSLNAALAAIGAACVGLSFGPFYSYELNGRANVGGSSACNAGSIHIEISGGLCDGATITAWHGVLGWLGVALAAIGALIAVARIVSPGLERGSGWAWACAGAFDLAVVFELVSIGVVPDHSFTARVRAGSFDTSVRVPARDLDAAPAWAFWVALGLIVIGAAIAAVLAVRTARAARPNRPGGPHPHQHGGWQPPPNPPPGWQPPPQWQQGSGGW
jgi:hypothetical protein